MPVSSLLPALDEAEVRHLCGPASYARATALQAAGHVARPQMNNLTLSADVRGTWRRIDRRDPQAGALPQHGGERSASEGYDFAVGLFREQLQFVGCPVNGRTARTRVRYAELAPLAVD